MKILILFTCALAVAQAGYAAPYYYAQHYPAIGHNGAPVETPEVQLAKAQHFAAHAAARSGGHYGALASVGPLPNLYGLPAITHNGLPLDTPEVAAAKAQHFHDYAVAAQRNGVHGLAAPLVSAHPIDTPEVQVAKAAHFAAHAEAAARNAHGLGHYRRRRGIYSAYPQHIPVIDHNGVPVETPEVQAAKAQHFAEYAKAAGRGAGHAVATPVVPYNSGYAAHYSPYRYSGPTAQIGHDGQPIETYEVQAAKAAHLAAHAAAKSGYYAHY